MKTLHDHGKENGADDPTQHLPLEVGIAWALSTYVTLLVHIYEG